MWKKTYSQGTNECNVQKIQLMFIKGPENLLQGASARSYHSMSLCSITESFPHTID
jgi:hypothetical protein